MNDDRIVSVRAATIKHELETPIQFGSWVMRHREFVLIRIDAASGLRGFAYCLTRDGPVADIVHRTVAPVYEGRPVDDPKQLFYDALWTNHAVHAAGIGMRALSIVDVAAWDLAARAAGQSISAYLGGERHPMPVAGIVGYPPSLSPEETAAQVTDLWSKGWRRFKMAIAPTLDLSMERMMAARQAAPDGWIGFDANMVFRSAQDAIAFGKRLEEVDCGWFEDIVPPGDAQLVADIRAGVNLPVAMGDEQGGSYHPQALLEFDAVDVVRVDVTTNGGITRLPQILDAITARGVAFAPHMFPHVHSQVLSALGYTDAPIEWGIPGTGVHPMDDCIAQPIVSDGRMEQLPEGLGLGTIVNPEWIATQGVTDPSGMLDDL
ncbi:MAG: enolase C-terminal domain-like protein [Acidimicrobiia bacterium]